MPSSKAKSVEPADLRRVVLFLYPNAGYDRGLLQGIRQYTRVHGTWIFYLAGEEPGLPLPQIEAISNTQIRAIDAGEKKRRMYVPNLRQWGATGIIGRLITPEIEKMAKNSGIPAIALDLSDEQLARDSRLADFSEIRPDSHKAGRMAAEHLLERSFASFGFCGFADRTWSDRRRDGFCERLREAGFSCDVYRAPRLKNPFLWRLERKYVMAWLDGLPKPVGIMTCNDVRGMQVLESCAARSIPVPDEVAVVGADDDQLLCDLSNPSLSSVSWNLEKAGFRAAELLDAMMTGKKVPSRRIDVEPLWVTARQSTDAVAVEDRDVAAALRFIRQNANRPIGVNHVVAQVAISRRSLEMRFENCLGRTIRAEIERMRIARTKRLLQETDMAIAKIADAAGFSSLSYLCKVFRRETGETPAQYRRRNRVS